MIKYVILISTLVCLAYSQRPSYAGSPGRYPVVLPQYITTPATPSLGNRIDSQIGSQNGGGSLAADIKPAMAPATSTAVPADLPLEANGDASLVDIISKWPRDKQPFWYINQVQLNAHRGVPNVAGTATQPPQPLSRSFFEG